MFNLDPTENLDQDCQLDNFNESGVLAVDYISGFAAFSTGMFLAAVRLYEPFFFFIIKQNIFMWFGEVLDPTGIKTKPLSTFLASSLNVELVHVILKGIKKFSNIKMQQPQIADLDITQEEAEDFLE